MAAGAVARRLRWSAHPLDVLFATAWMVVAEVGVRLVPLPRLARWVGAPLGTEPAVAPRPHPSLRASERRRVQLAQAIGRRWPFADGPCLRQAVVAGRALRRHGPVLRIGAALDGGAVVGHAWLEVGGLEIGRAVAGSDGDHVLDSGRESTLYDGLAVGVKLLAIDVAMGVDQAHLSRAPTGTSSRNAAKTGLPSLRDAATIMPWDSRPRSLRGCRFATMTTLRPTRFSGR